MDHEAFARGCARIHFREDRVGRLRLSGSPSTTSELPILRVDENALLCRYTS